MKNKFLVNALHRIANGIFWLSLLFTLFTSGVDVFTNDGKIGSGWVGNHHSKGYGIPVKVHLSVLDSIITFRGENFVRSTNYSKSMFDYPRNINMDSISKLPDVKKTICKNEIYLFSDKDLDVNLDMRANEYIIVKSPNSIFTILQIISHYLKLIVTISIFYFLSKIFHQLSRDLSFSNGVAKGVKWMGLIFMSAEVIQAGISLVFSKYFSGLHLMPTKKGMHLETLMKYQVNPRINFDFTFFFIGLSLLVLSALLKMGSTIEEDNDLTI